jgi:SAM-dependent methyltransferase
MDAAAWDRRYADTALVWTAEPNRFLVEQVAELPVGRALDLAAGEGRNAVWLAERGWQTTAVDFSPVGIDKGRRLAGERGVTVDWVVADVTSWRPPVRAFQLVAVFYLHLPPGQRRDAYRIAASAVAPGGVLLVVGHDRDNLEHGVGGPQVPGTLLTVDEVTADLHGTAWPSSPPVRSTAESRSTAGHVRPSTAWYLLTAQPTEPVITDGQGAVGRPTTAPPAVAQGGARELRHELPGILAHWVDDFLHGVPARFGLSTLRRRLALRVVVATQVAAMTVAAATRRRLAAGVVAASRLTRAATAVRLPPPRAVPMAWLPTAAVALR